MACAANGLVRTNNSCVLIGGLLDMTHLPYRHCVIVELRLDQMDNIVDHKPLTCDETHMQREANLGASWRQNRMQWCQLTQGRCPCKWQTHCEEASRRPSWLKAKAMVDRGAGTSWQYAAQHRRSRSVSAHAASWECWLGLASPQVCSKPPSPSCLCRNRWATLGPLAPMR